MVNLHYKSLFFAAFGLMLAGCSSMSGLSNYVPGFVKPFRVDIQQGNFVTAQDVDRLQIGMSKDQVRFILGTPLLNSPFHADRWDYVYRLTRADGQFSQARYTVIFENGALARHGGENLPADSTDFLAPGDQPPPRPQAEKPAEPQVTGTETAPVLK